MECDNLLWDDFENINEDELLLKVNELKSSSFIYIGKPDMVHDKTLDYDFTYLDARGIKDFVLGELLKRKIFHIIFIDNRYKKRLSAEQKAYILSLESKFKIIFVK